MKNKFCFCILFIFYFVFQIKSQSQSFYINQNEVEEDSITKQDERKLFTILTQTVDKKSCVFANKTNDWDMKLRIKKNKNCQTIFKKYFNQEILNTVLRCYKFDLDSHDNNWYSAFNKTFPDSLNFVWEWRIDDFFHSQDSLKNLPNYNFKWLYYVTVSLISIKEKNSIRTFALTGYYKLRDYEDFWLKYTNKYFIADLYEKKNGKWEFREHLINGY